MQVHWLNLFLLVAAVALAVGGLVSVIAPVLRRRAAEAFERKRALAASIGLEYSEPKRQSPAMTGSIDGLPVRIDLVTVVIPVGKTVIVQQTTRYAVATGLDLSVQSEGIGTAVRKAVGGSEIEIGDPGFDAAAFVTGDESTARAALTAEARARLLEALGAKAHLEKGQLVFVATGHVSSEEAAKAALAPLLAAGRALRMSAESVPQRLAATVSADPVGIVRARALKALLASFPDHPATARAKSAAANDAEPAVRGALAGAGAGGLALADENGAGRLSIAAARGDAVGTKKG